MQRVNIKQRYIFSAVSCQCVKEVSGVKYVQVLSSTICRLKCISLTLTFFRYIHLSSWCSVPPHGPSWSKYSQDHFSINISLYRNFINQPATLEWKRQKLFFLRKNSFNRQADWPPFNFGTQNSSALYSNGIIIYTCPLHTSLVALMNPSCTLVSHGVFYSNWNPN